MLKQTFEPMKESTRKTCRAKLIMKAGGKSHQCKRKAEVLVDNEPRCRMHAAYAALENCMPASATA